MMNLAKSGKKALLVLLAACMILSGMLSATAAAEEILVEAETEVSPDLAGGPETDAEIIEIGENAETENLLTDSESGTDIIIEEISDVTEPNGAEEMNPCETACEINAEDETDSLQTEEEPELGEPVSAAAISSNVITMDVNQQKTLYLDMERDETFMSGLWNSNSSALELRTAGGSSCTVKVLEYSSVDLVVDCKYYCFKHYTIAGKDRTQLISRYASFTIHVNGGPAGNYTISSSVSSVNIDLTNGRGKLVLTSGVELSDTVYIKDNSPSGNCVSVSLDKKEGNKAYYTVYPLARGTQNVKFQLIWKQNSSTEVIKDSVTILCIVNCSHSYDQGTVTKSPTATETGVRVYVCQKCGNTKTEVIPAAQNTIEECEISLSKTEYTYSGEECRPGVVVRHNGSALTQGTDYKVTYQNNINAGTGTVTVEGTGTYSGTASRSFAIGKAEQNLKVAAKTNTLKEGDTLQIQAEGIGTISFSSDDSSVASVDANGLVTGKKEGSAVITVKASGDGNHNSASKKAEIHVTKVQTAKISFSEPSVRVKAGESGILTVTVSGDLPSRFQLSFTSASYVCFSPAWDGSWKGKSHDIKITGKKKGTETLVIYLKDAATGKAVTSSEIEVVVEQESAPAGGSASSGNSGSSGGSGGSSSGKGSSGGSASGSGSSGGSASGSGSSSGKGSSGGSGASSGGSSSGKGSSGGSGASGSGSSGGSPSGSSRTSISDCTLRLSASAFTYNGRRKTPSVIAKDGNRLLVKGMDYTVKYRNNVRAGTASVVITGKGNYTGSVTKNFVIRKASQNFRLLKSSYIYTKSSLKYGARSFLIRTANGKGTISLESGSGYIKTAGKKVTIKKGTPKGIYKIKVTASGGANYNAATRTVKITIR